MIIPGAFFEGNDWLELYRRNPDPLFAPRDLRVGDQHVQLFSGKIQLSSWLGFRLPLPLIPVSFMGSPVTDLFPSTMSDSGSEPDDMVRCAENAAVGDGSLAIIVKDLPAGHFLEQALSRAGFISITHEPIWYCRVPDSLDAFFAGLTKGKMRRSLRGHLRKFNKHVRVRPARDSDLDFMNNSYRTVWHRADMRLEQLTGSFFRATLSHPACRIVIFEKEGTPFAFQMIWQKNDVWFDKYIGTDTSVYREYSFFSMRILYFLDIAHSLGIKWFIAGQGSGKDKAGLGFKSINVNLWVKPLSLKLISPYLMKRFAQIHNKRIYKASVSIE